jgi:hypothetical protein
LEKEGGARAEIKEYGDTVKSKDDMLSSLKVSKEVKEELMLDNGVTSLSLASGQTPQATRNCMRTTCQWPVVRLSPELSN